MRRGHVNRDESKRRSAGASIRSGGESWYSFDCTKWPKILGSQQCTPGEGWPDTVPRTRLLGFHPRALPQNRAKPLSTEQPRWPYAGLSTNPRTIGWQTVPGIGLPAWYVGASPQGIQQRSTDSAGTIMLNMHFPVGVRWIGPRTARGGGLAVAAGDIRILEDESSNNWASVYGNATMPNFCSW